MYKWKVEVEENTQLSFEEKNQKIKRHLSLFSPLLGSAEEKSNERRFKVHFVCFIEEKVCFGMEIYQLALCYWLFSQTSIKFKQIFIGNTLRFETTLLASFHRKILVELRTHYAGIVEQISLEYGNMWVFKYTFFKKWLLCLLFCLCSFITVVQRTVVKQQHLNCSRIASAPAVLVNFCNFDFHLDFPGQISIRR